MGCVRTSESRECQWAPRCLLRDFTDDALTISVGIFFPKWDSPNGESVLATAGTTSPLVELVGVATWSFVGWACEGGLHWEVRKTMGDLEHGYYISTDSPVFKIK